MRAFAAYLLALGLVVSPAMAAAGPAGDKDKDNSTAAKTSSTAASDDKTAGSNDASATASKPNPEAPGKTAASSTLESELQQLRELLETQSRQIQIQNEQMREQQERMEAMEAELKVATTPPILPTLPLPIAASRKTRTAPLRLPRASVGLHSVPRTDRLPARIIQSQSALRASLSLRADSWRLKPSSAIRPWVRTSTPRSTTFRFLATPVVRRPNGTHPPGNRVSVCWRRES